MDVASSWHPQGQWLALDSFGGARVHFVRPRPLAGPPLVLLHGFAQSSWAWRFVLPALCQQFDAIAVCLPGLGWSDKPPHAAYRHALQVERIVELLDRLHFPSAHFGGNSMGGAIAMRLAAEHPRRVQRLVLVGPAAHGMFPAALLAETQHEAMAPLWSLPGFDRLLRLGLTHGAYKHLPVDDHYMAHFLAPLRATGGVAATLQIARFFRRDLQLLEPFLPQITAPTLLIWGKHDRLVPRHIVRHVVRRVPQTRLLMYDDCGHCPQEEQPERFTADVRQFLTESA
jgi:pimeloyl-ACP methyl ester carboxylesterase